ncbi:MAG TPA: hypothetical protein DCP11_14750 [Microbacteriaceae bacterium]|jgi:hypothetical protein|nr:hypothetical protein [Microbacteriaceae bacterium]
MADIADRGARKVASSAPLRTAARAGYAVNGIVHALIGVTAISVAVGPGGEADQTGALGELAAAPGGRLLLWVIAIALFALALWQVLHALLVRGVDSKRRWAHRLGDLAKAVVYVAVGVTALTFALGSSSSAAASSQSLSARILSMPGGVALLIVVGLGVFGIGVALILRGVSRRFLKRITVPPGSLGRFVTALGVIGYSAEGVALMVVGILFWVAAATLDPTRASGLDGALRALAGVPFGEFILVVIGAGFIAYGLYSEFRARYARL